MKPFQAFNFLYWVLSVLQRRAGPDVFQASAAIPEFLYMTHRRASYVYTIIVFVSHGAQLYPKGLT